MNGLARGRSEFCRRVGKEFFGDFGNSEVSDADVTVDVTVEKAEGFIGVDCRILGTVTLPCDRCLEPLTLPVDTVARLSVKFCTSVPREDGPAASGGEREILYLSEADTDLDLSQTVYDYALLALPMQKVHAEGECNPQTLKYLSRASAPAEAPKAGTESPFAALKAMMENNK